MIQTFISTFIQFDPNLAWPMVNRFFRKEAAREIAKCYPPYYYMRLNKYLQTSAPFLKYADYTPEVLTRTLPLGILTNYRALPLFDCYWDWDEQTLDARRTEAKSYSDYSLRQVRYFLSLEATELLPLAQPQIRTFLQKDPQFLRRLLRYIFDQIHLTVLKRRYPADLYATIPLFLEADCQAHLTAEDWHYALLIHIHTILTRTEKDVELHKRCINLITLILDKLKMKNADLEELTTHLQALLSPAKEADLIVKMHMHVGKRYATMQFKQNLRDVRNVLKRHFPELALEASCCIIS